MEYVLIWIGLAFLVAWGGEGTTLGFWGSFLVAVIFSPLIGLIAILVSPNKANRDQQQILFNQQQQLLNQQQQINAMKPKKDLLPVADELIKLKKLCDDGVLTKEEYETQKKKLLD